MIRQYCPLIVSALMTWAAIILVIVVLVVAS